MIRVVAAIVLIGVCTLPANAQQAPPWGPNAPFMLLSNGQDSCGEFLEGTPQYQLLDVEWILGFISGTDSRATASERMVGSSFRDGEAVRAWVQQYCQTHASDYLPGAAEALRTEFAKQEAQQ